ncbi:MAG: IS200/IS605 family transposase [Armatimonadetes bacterium]|nr:IS200/IS605 family transposase [Armatimonadota bacterium]
MEYEFRRQGHCVYHARYHLVISTKYRRKIIKPGMDTYLKQKVREASRHYPEIVVLEMNTDKDHMHLLLSVPPKLSVADAVKILKSNTGRAMRQKFPFLDKVYWGEDGIWSIGYFVSTVGVNEEVIRRYIEQQGQEDSGQAQLVLYDAAGVSP